MILMLRSARVRSFSLCGVLKEVIIAVPLAFPLFWVGASSMVMVQQARLLWCWFLQLSAHSPVGPFEWQGLCAEGIVSGRLGATESLKGRVKETQKEWKGLHCCQPCAACLQTHNRQSRKLFYSHFYLGKAGGGKLSNDTVNRELLLLSGHSAWAVSILFSVPVSSSSFPKLFDILRCTFEV